MNGSKFEQEGILSALNLWMTAGSKVSGKSNGAPSCYGDSIDHLSTGFLNGNNSMRSNGGYR